MSSPSFSSADEAAAWWDARLRSPLCTAEDRAAFAAWRDADPAHGAAYGRMQSVLQALHDAYATSPDLRAYRDEALRARPPRPYALAAGLAAAVVVAGAGLAAWLAVKPSAPLMVADAAPAPSIYQTALGERTVVQLSDGSKVTLNTQSRLEVVYTARRRAVKLTAGQGLFQVAKDASRPFVVTAGARQVTAVGTEFDVRLDPALVSVTLVEGRVRVQPAGGRATGEEQNLVAGQRLTATGAGLVRVTMVDPHAAVSWSQGRVLFEDTPLVDAVAEINRYSPVRFSIVDPSIESIRINGMFRTEQPMSFVRALASYLPIELKGTAAGVTLAARHAAPR